MDGNINYKQLKSELSKPSIVNMSDVEEFEQKADYLINKVKN
jgi:hypothetical protein